MLVIRLIIDGITEPSVRYEQDDVFSCIPVECSPVDIVHWEIEGWASEDFEALGAAHGWPLKELLNALILDNKCISGTLVRLEDGLQCRKNGKEYRYKKTVAGMLAAIEDGCYFVQQ